MSRADRIVGNTSWLTVDTFIGFGCDLIASVAVARVLGPAKLGYFAYVLFLANLAGALAMLGIPAATRKYVAEYVGRGDLATALAVIRFTSLFQAAMTAVLVCGGSLFVLTSVPEPHRLYTLLAVLALAPRLAMSISTAVNFAIENIAANVWASVCSSIVNLLGVGLSLWRGWDLVGLTGTLLVARTVDYVIRHRLQTREMQRRLDASGQSDLVAAGLPGDMKRRLRRFCAQSIVLQALGMVVWDRSEVFFLKQFSDVRQIAFYSTSFNITQQLLLLPQAFSTAASASLMLRMGQDPEAAGRMAGTTLRYLALVGVPAGLGLAALSLPAVKSIYGSQYLPAVPVLTVLAAFAFAKAAIAPVQQLIVAADRQDVLVKWSLVMAIFNVALDLLLIPSYQAVGAAVANGLAQTMAAVGLWYFAATRLSASPPLTVLAKISVSASVAAGAAFGIGRALRPAFLGLLAAVPFSCIGFVLALRLLRALDRADLSRLAAIDKRLPAAGRSAFRLLLHAAIPGHWG